MTKVLITLKNLSEEARFSTHRKEMEQESSLKMLFCYK